MSAGAETVVRARADLLADFYTPNGSGRRIGIDMGGAGQEVVPESDVGKLVDLMFGQHLDGGEGEAAGTQGMVAVGLKLARCYRVAANMNDAILRRADALDPRLRIGVDEIEPPRAEGFVHLDEPIVYARNTETGASPGICAISWSVVADTPKWSANSDFSLLVIAWDDMHRSEWITDERHQRTRAEAGYTSRWVPTWARSIRIGAVRLGKAEVLHPNYTIAQRYGPYRSPVRVIAALWQMLAETVPADAVGDDERVDQEAVDVSRGAQRAARRAGVLDQGAVTTVTLRRECRPVQAPGTGTPHDSRIWIEQSTAWRWIGSAKRGDRRRVRVPVRAHWSSRDMSLPVRERTIVSELRR